MLFAGLEAHMVKNCDRGLDVTDFTIRTHPKPANSMFIFSCSKLVSQPIINGFVYATLSIGWRAVTNDL